MKLDEFKQIARHVQPPFTPESYAAVEACLREMGMEPGNVYQELEMSSRFAQAHQDTSYSNALISLHSHRFYEILCCRNTCGAEYLVGTERYRLQKGDIVFITPGTSHRPLLPDAMPEPYIRDVLWVSPEFVSQLQQQFALLAPRPNPHSSLLRTAGTQWSYLSGMLHALAAEAEQQAEGWEMAVAGAALTFMVHLKRAFLDQNTPAIAAEKPDLLERVLTYIEANLARKITLPDAARQFYVSESTIRQTFRRKMGVSFYRCVTQRRLITAKRLILENEPLERVAALTGFSDYSAFYRAFRQEYGISPRQYRLLEGPS